MDICVPYLNLSDLRTHDASFFIGTYLKWAIECSITISFFIYNPFITARDIYILTFIKPIWGIQSSKMTIDEPETTYSILYVKTRRYKWWVPTRSPGILRTL